mgnify:CR=1 FL=1
MQRVGNPDGTSEADEPGFEQARRPVVFRAYRIENDWFGNGKTVDQLESYFISQGKRLFVERMRHGSSIVNDIIPGQLLQKGDEVVLSGRREFAIGEEDWIGEEIVDPQLLDFPVEVLPVMIHKKPYFNQKLDFIRRQSFMHGSVYAVSNGQVLISLFSHKPLSTVEILWNWSV